MLVRNGSNLNAKDQHQNTPLHSCLLRVSNPDHRYEIARLLVSHGADVNAKNADNKKPLDLANTNKSTFYDYEHEAGNSPISFLKEKFYYFSIVEELLRNNGAGNF